MTSGTTRGAALISALILTLILTMMVGGIAYEVGAATTLSYARDHQDSAMDLAEAGIAYELNYISTQERSNSTPLFHTNAQQSGQPFPGQPGAVSGTPGQYWVYTSWVGGNSFTISCTAEVGGETKTVAGATVLLGGARRTIQVSGNTQSLLGLYAAFATRAPTAANHNPSVTLANGAVVSLQTKSTIPGLIATVGTNGPVSIGTGSSIGPSTGYVANFFNADTSSSYNSNAQFKTGTLIKDSNIESPFPSVPAIIRHLFNLTGSDSAAWTYLSNNNNNANILMYKSGLGSGAAISPSSVVTRGFPSTQSTLTNTSSGGIGDWQTANFIPGSSSVKALIFPPGDYYFTSMSLPWNANTQIIIDNARLAGSGPGQVRFWFTSSGNDGVGIPFALTNAADPSTFRIYYGKDASTLTISKVTGTPAGNWTTAGAIYAISGGASGATVQLAGGADSTDQVVLDGSLIADNLSFSGFCSVLFDPTDNHVADYQAGAGFNGQYTDNGG